MNQLVLDLAPPPQPTLDNFVSGVNGEALAVLHGLLQPVSASTGADLRAVYLWGASGSGRSHLLQALAHARGATDVRLLDAQSPATEFLYDPSIGFWLLDDCDRLDAARQEVAFHLFAALQGSRGAVWVATGACPPAAMTVMPELATRLGWGLVLQLHPLSDDDTALALSRTLAERGVATSADLIPWLMAHAPRNLGTLRSLIDALDTYALSRKRGITLPLLREFMQLDLPGTGTAPDTGTVAGNDLP